MTNNNPRPDFSSSGPIEYSMTPEKPSKELELLLAREEEDLFAIQGVTSVGIGIGSSGCEILEVGVIEASVASQLPSEIKGVSVEVRVTGEVKSSPQR